MTTPTAKRFKPNTLDRIVTLSFSNDAAATGVDSFFFIADRKYEVVGISEIHVVAGNNGSDVTLQITRCQGTEVPSAGDVLTTAAFNLKSTAATLVNATLTATTAHRVLEVGNRLGADFTGTLTTLSGGVVQVVLRPIEV